MKIHIPLTDDELVTFKSIKEILEAEREIKPSDLDLISLLVVNLSMMEHALDDIRANGVTITSHTAHGLVSKSNSANEVFSKANIAIRGCMEQLLMTPKAKAAIIKKEAPKEEKEDDDPLMALLKKRQNKE